MTASTWRRPKTPPGHGDSHLARRRRAGGKFEDYSTPVTEGMVVLDAVHQVQATQANDLAVRWNCKAGKCGSCSAEINGKPRLMCMTQLDTTAPRPADHPRADAGLPAHQGPGDRRLVELPGQEADPAVQAAAARRPRRHLAHGAGRRGPRAGIPQVHRVLPVPGRLPRAARSPQARGSFIGPRFLVHVAALEMHPLDTADRLAELKQAQGIGLLQHHQVLHQGLPGAHHHHRQRDHPAEGARRGRVLRSADAPVPDLPTGQVAV